MSITPDAPTLADVEAEIAGLTEPLRHQLRVVEGRERLILADLEETRAVKSRLLATLRKLDPTVQRPGPKKKGTTGTGPAQKEARRREAVAEAKKAIDQLAAKGGEDGFTRTAVHTQMKLNGIAIGEARVGEAVASLHESGYLTLHKLVTGGNKSYKRTEDLSNGDPRPAN